MCRVSKPIELGINNLIENEHSFQDKIYDNCLLSKMTWHFGNNSRVS